MIEAVKKLASKVWQRIVNIFAGPVRGDPH